MKIRLLEKLKREIGSQVLEVLDDPDIIEIMLNPDGSLWIERLGADMQCVGRYEQNPMAFIGTVATMLGTTITAQNPILECELPIDGSRFEALIPPIVSNPTFTIRKKASKIFPLETYLESGALTKEQYDFLRQAIKDRKNILIAGGTGSGKTTFANALIKAIEELTPEHRIVIMEDTPEIQCSAANKVILQATKETSLLHLIKATMRLRPDRILVGEVRGGEALDLLKAWNTGHPGGVATVHANSAPGALRRLEQLISEVTPARMSALVAEAVDVVVFIQKEGKLRKIQEMVSVQFDIKNQSYTLKEFI